MEVLGTGLSGLVGSRIVELLTEFDFCDLSFETGVDITNREQVFEKIRASGADWILHMAAKTDVDSCESDKQLGLEGATWKINVNGTRNIFEASQKTGKRILYISTDFVFDGTKNYYFEEDEPHPVNWYGMTKYEGEKIVLANRNNLVVRITYPYRAKNWQKRDFVHSTIDQLQLGKPLVMLKDHFFTPTLIDDIARAIKILISNNLSGIYHVVGSSFLTPMEAGIKIAREFNLDHTLIRPITMRKYFINRAKRPYYLRTKNDKIISLGIKMHSFLQGLKEIKDQGLL